MSDSILPVIDRRAPLLERIRGEDGEESFEDLGNRLGKEVGSIALMDTETDELEQAKEDVTTGIITGIASSTGLEEDEVDEEFASELADDVFNDKSDILEPPEELTEDEIESEED